MSVRFEINVMGNGRYRVYDDYWDTVDIIRISDSKDVKASAVRLVDEQVKKGSHHTWFAVGESGHDKIFEISTICFPIPGRRLRYRYQIK